MSGKKSVISLNKSLQCAQRNAKLIGLQLIQSNQAIGLYHASAKQI